MCPVHSAEFVHRDGHQAIDGFVEQRETIGFPPFCSCKIRATMSGLFLDFLKDNLWNTGSCR